MKRRLLSSLMTKLLFEKGETLHRQRLLDEHRTLLLIRISSSTCSLWMDHFKHYKSFILHRNLYSSTTIGWNNCIWLNGMPVDRVYKVRVNITDTTGSCFTSIHKIHNSGLPNVININAWVFEKEGSNVIGVGRTPTHTNKRDFILQAVSSCAGNLLDISTVVDINTSRQTHTNEDFAIAVIDIYIIAFNIISL